MTQRLNIKSTAIDGREKRRQEMLERQKEARRDMANHARELVSAAISDVSDIAGDTLAYEEASGMDEKVRCTANLKQ